MIIRYGGYSHGDGEASVSISRFTEENERGQPFSTRHQWVIQGRIIGTSSSDVAAKCRRLEQAYLNWYQDLELLDGSTVIHKLPQSSSWSGVKITQPPQYPDGSGAQATTFRDYRIVAEADYLVTDLPALRSFRESITIRPGRPEYAVVELVSGRPQVQLIKERRAWSATQSGEAVGYLAYPSVPAPIWPGVPYEGPEISEQMPSINASGLPWLFPISWSYRFISADPLVGHPTFWPN